MPFPLGRPYEDALLFASRVHRGQYRKGTAIPYLSHVLAVSALALEHGADEEIAAAALLHDAVEDGGGLPVLEEIRAGFGERVAALVMECTDAHTKPKPPWRARKEAYLARLPQASEGGKLIALCDKVHNITALVRDLESGGEAVWGRFNASPEDTLWYYRKVAEILGPGRAGSLERELAAKLEALARRVEGRSGAAGISEA